MERDLNQTHVFTNKSPYSQIIRVGDPSDTPFSGYQVTDTPIGGTEIVSVTLSALPYYTLSDLGSLSDPLGGGAWNGISHTFTETAISTGTPTPATQILDRLVYKPPMLPAGQGQTVLATVSVDDQTDPNGPVRLETVTPPLITGTVANEPVASGSTIRPFATTYVMDGNFGYNTHLEATVVLTDGGKVTDADGLLSGSGLSKTGTGTYTLSGNSLYNLSSLVFTPTAPGVGATRTTAFELKVVDTQANLSADDKNTSVIVIGPTASPVAPLVSGTWGGQTVAANGTIKPFSAVTVSDTNAKPLDAVTLTISGGGTLSGQGLSNGANGVYTIAAGSPQTVTTILNALVFKPPALATGQTSNTINIRLDVTDGAQVATDNATLINEKAAAAPPAAAVSANNSVVMAGSGAAITDGGGNVWSIDSFNKVAVNGTEDRNTGGVVELAYVNGTIWQENNDSLWWGKTSPNDSWSPDYGTPTSPLAAGPAPSPSPAPTPAPSPMPTPTPVPTTPPSGVTVFDTTMGQAGSGVAQPYAGPVSGLTSEYINTTSNSLNVTASAPNCFIHTGSGNDAIAVSSGTNVLDGFTGSNFLTGGTGNDTFFVDDRNSKADIWSTVNNFHSGDAATIWGVTPGDFNLAWMDGQGAAGYIGLTLHATATGKPTASLTLVGFTSGDLNNGKLSVSYGTTAAAGGVAGSSYMNVHANY